MRNIDILPSKPPVRRVCADFHGEAAVEVDMLEVQIGINRAARNKSERDAVLMEIALLSLRKHVEAFSALTGDKYPDYQSVVRWLETDQKKNPDEKPSHLPENRPIAISDQSPTAVEQSREVGIDGG